MDHVIFPHVVQPCDMYDMHVQIKQIINIVLMPVLLCAGLGVPGHNKKEGRRSTQNIKNLLNKAN